MRIISILILSFMVSASASSAGDGLVRSCNAQSINGNKNDEIPQLYTKLNCLIDQKNYNKAENLINTLIEKDSDIYLLQKRAEVFVEAGKPELAIEDCRRVIEVVKNDDTCHLIMGRAYNKIGNHFRAKQVLLDGLIKQGIELDVKFIRSADFRLSEWEEKYFLEILDALESLASNGEITDRDIEYLLYGIKRNNSSTPLFDGVVNFLRGSGRSEQAHSVISKYCQGIIALESSFCDERKER